MLHPGEHSLVSQHHLQGGAPAALSKGHSIALSSQLPRNEEECVKASELHDHGPTVTNNLTLSEFLDQKQSCVDYHDGGKAFFRSIW